MPDSPGEMNETITVRLLFMLTIWMNSSINTSHLDEQTEHFQSNGKHPGTFTPDTQCPAVFPPAVFFFQQAGLQARFVRKDKETEGMFNLCFELAC